MSVETIEVPITQGAEAAKPTTQQPEEKTEEFTYEYQPKDAEGRPLGGKQVIKAKNAQEALDKMANQNTELIRLNRKMKQNVALGTADDDLEAIPAEAERETAEKFTLTTAEKIQFAQDLNNPEKVEDAVGKIVEKRIGRVANDLAAMRAFEEAKAFREEHSEFYPSQDNIKVLITQLKKHNLKPTKANFELVYGRAVKAGWLEEAPAAEAAPVTTEENQPEAEPVEQPRRVPSSSGVKRSTSAPSSAPGTARVKTYTKAEIAKMSAAEYREKVLNPQLRAQQARRQA